MSTKIGEVIEASTIELVAECYDLHTPPALGSLVKVSDSELNIFGIVCNATTESTDPGRRPIARGKDVANVDEIYREHPQLTMLLRTTVNILVVGHKQGDNILHHLPSHPPRVHSFVDLCDQEEVRQFTRSLDFLTTLLDIKGGNGDEVVSACLRLASTVHDDQHSFLVRAGKELALLLNNDLNRLNAILRRIRP